jgi:hypothetical protein
MSSKEIYQFFNKQVTTPLMPAGYMSLSQWLNEDYKTIDWKAIFTKPHITARDVYAKYFQYRIIHNILPVNFKLYKWKLIDSAKCHFWHKEDETVYQLFAECVICTVSHFGQILKISWKGKDG